MAQLEEHPPVANRIVMVDLDATIQPWGPLQEMRAPHEEVALALRELQESGYTIIIFTSRLSETWLKAEHVERGFPTWQAFRDQQVQYVVDYMERFNLPYDGVTAEKRPAEAYFDDKAVRVTADTLAEAIYEWLEERPAE